MFEELPINTRKKSFNELLEEQITEDAYQPQKRDLQKKEFLRRKSNPPAEYQVAKYEEPEEKQEKTAPKLKKNISGDLARPTNEKKFLKKGEGKTCLTKAPEKEKPRPKPKKMNENPRSIENLPVVIKEAKPPPRVKEPEEKKKKEEIIYYDLSALNSEQEVKKEVKSKTEEIYNQKMTELNYQIDRFKQQSAVLKSENKELKLKIAQIEQDLSKFNEGKEKRISDLQSLKESEFKRMKKERLELEKTLKNEPKKSSELEDLRSLLYKTQEELTIKEYKEKENLECLTEELSKINSEVNELETQIRMKEQLIIKDKWTKDKKPTEKVYQNGTRVKNFADGKKVIYFTNGDIKETHPDGKVIYIYNDDQITEITLPDGTSICEFSNGQIEKTLPNGLKEITFPDGTSQKIYNN